MASSPFDLLSLPDTILNDVLCYRLGNIKELVRLDTAMCHHRMQDEWLRLVCTEHFIFQQPVNISNRAQVRWLWRMDIKARSIAFIEECDERLVSDYLRISGPSVRKVYLKDGSKSVEMLLVALYCKNITSIYALSVHLRPSFGDMLLSNPNIHEIFFEDVTSSETRLIEGVSLPKLRILHAVSTTCVPMLVEGLSSKGTGIQTLVMDGSTFIFELDNFVRICSQLRSFCNNRGLRRSFTEQFSLCTPLLCNLSFSGCAKLPDVSVQFIAKNMVSLRSLNIRECSSLTDASLQTIADYAGERLEVLYTDVKDPESAATEAILSSFSVKCVQLKYLNVNCGAKVLCAGSGVSALVSGCPKLHTLVVNTISTIGASSRNFVAMLRASLKLLVHDESTEYDIMATYE